ncbi:unnamed protein product [Durusdinium trenchii]|uniref:Kinesin motor domain-containing protein n=1 Tax=Durusdinium trenchii TaxID=1381693 RepID=A0ABP0S4E9_9DINO
MADRNARSAPVAAVRIRPWLKNEQDLPERLAVPPRNPRTTVRGPTRATAPRAAAPTADARRRGARAAQRVAVAYGGETYPAHYIFGPQHSQQAVYKELLTKLIGEAIASNASGTVIACGPPMSGKSHTLLGYGSEFGLVPHATLDIFRAAEATKKLKVWCSYFELHHEVVDLLAPLPPTPSADVELVELRGAGAQVCGLQEPLVQSIEEVQALVDYGNQRRAANEKLLGVHGNAHTVFVFHLAIDEDPHGDGREPLSGSPASPVERRVRSKITFVDCASSNGFKDTSLQGLSESLKDQASGGVRAKGLGKAFFRRSLLTQLLEDALCGREQLVLLATASPGGGEQMGDYLEMVRHLTQVAEQEKRAPMEGTPSRMDCLGHLQVEIEALSMEGPPSESKEARLAALQRVLAERSLREAPEAFQVQQLVALRQAQEASLAAWGFACEEDLAAAPCYLLRLHGDPMLTGCLAYVITGSRILGSSGDIFLQGLGIAPQHCHIAEHSGGLWLTNLCSEPHRVFLNGKSMEATSPAEPLKHGDRIQLGCALEMLVVMNENLKNLDLEALEAGDLWSRPLDALVQQANELLKELELLQVSNQHSHFEVPEVDGGASPVRFVRWEHSERESGEVLASFEVPLEEFQSEVKRLQELYRSPRKSDAPKESPDTASHRTDTASHRVDSTREGLQAGRPELAELAQVESALWHKEKAVAASIRRAHSLSQCIGETVSALQETVADLRRGAAGAFTPVEAFEKLQDENQDLKQRLARLESHWAETWKPSSQRSSAAVPSEPSTASALSAATSVDRLRSARPRAVPRPSVVVRSGRMSSPVPTRAEPVAGPYLMRRTLPVPLLRHATEVSQLRVPHPDADTMYMPVQRVHQAAGYLIYTRPSK